MQRPLAASCITFSVILISFFVVSFLTNILGPIVPDIISGYRVTLGVAALLPFSFFIAYGLMSIPSGYFIERHGERSVMLIAFAVSSAASLAFAIEPSIEIAIVSLFSIGSGMAAIQTTLNPLLREVGGQRQFAFNSALAQLVFGSASFISPHLYSFLVNALARAPIDEGWMIGRLRTVTPPNLPWVSIYWLFAGMSLLMLIILYFVPFPNVSRGRSERMGSLQIYKSLLARSDVYRFFICIFAYVGSEQGCADWMSEFLVQYHHIEPHATGVAVVSWFWALLTAGCFVGLFLLRRFDCRHVLIGTSIFALLSLTLALYGPQGVSVMAFPAVGFFASVMWPILMSLALNSIHEHHGAFAGILSTGIMGGAIVPLLIGRISDGFGMRIGLSLLYLTFGCVLSVGFWARPLVDNVE